MYLAGAPVRRCSWALKAQDAQHHVAFGLTSLDEVENEDPLYVRITV